MWFWFQLRSMEIIVIGLPLSLVIPRSISLFYDQNAALFQNHNQMKLTYVISE